MLRTTISISDERVEKAADEVGKGNVSRFFKDAALYYIENKGKENLNKEVVKDIIIDYLKDIVASGPITQSNYMEAKETLVDDISAILELGE